MCGWKEVLSTAKDLAPAVTAGATLAGTVASLTQKQPKAPKVAKAEPAPTLSDADVQAKADEERRRLLMRKGTKSTIKTNQDELGTANIFRAVLGGA